MNPGHYIGNGGIKAMDVMKAFMSPERFAGFCQANIIKYVLRYRNKDGVLDLDELIDIEKKMAKEGENPWGATESERSRGRR